MALWQALPGIQPPNPIQDFKGVSKQDAFSIGDNFATEVKNLTSTNYPAMSVRDGYALFGNASLDKVTGMGVWKDTELHVISSGVWKMKKLNETFFLSPVFPTEGWSQGFVTNLSKTALNSFCNFIGAYSGVNLLSANGVDGLKRYDGSQVLPITGAPAGLNYIDAHDNRVYGAVGSILKWSALRKADDWTTVEDSGEIAIETNDGKDISALKAGPGHIVVFKPYTMHELYGTGPINYRLMPVSDKIGCVANNSAQMLGGVLYFLGHDGIYQYAGGAIPKKDFATPVQGYIDRITYSARDKAAAGTDGKRYLLAIPIDGATEPNMILEYDPRFGTWYVQDYGHPTTSFAYMKEKTYHGSSGGFVYQTGGTDDNRVAIPWEWQSKPFGSGPLSAKKNWYRLWFVVDLPTGSTCDVYLSGKAEGDEWTKVNTITANADIQMQQVIIPVGMVANKNWMRVNLVGTGPATIHEVTRQERIMPMGV